MAKNKIIEGILLGSFLLGLSNSTVYARCHGWGCVSKAGGDAVKTVKHAGGVVGGISQDARREIADLPTNLAVIWHEVYGVVPEWARDYMNDYAAEAIGAYFGGLEGAALAKVTHNVYNYWEEGVREAKRAKDDNVPEFIQQLLLDIGIESAYKIASVGHTWGPESAKYAAMVDFIDEQQIYYSSLARSAANENEANKILLKYKKSLLDFEFELSMEN